MVTDFIPDSGRIMSEEYEAGIRDRLLVLANKALELRGRFCVIPILLEMLRLRNGEKNDT